MRLVTEWFGTFLLAGDRVVDQVLFPREADAIAQRLATIAQGHVLEEERALATKAQGSLEVAEDRLAALPGAKVVPEAPSSMSARAEGFGFPRTLLHDASLIHAKNAMRHALASPDRQVVQAVDALDDMAEAVNLLSERLREWYALHYPEAVQRVERHEELAGLISAQGNRDAIRAQRPDLPGDSMGGPLGPEEERAVRAFARVTSSLYATRAEIERYLDLRVPTIAPNLSELLGAPLAARMLKLAGGLQALAKMPSGTIQTLGAEKALFRHIVEGGKPPKHGVLIQHPLLHRAPRRERGSLARALAARVAIAARADAYTHNAVAADLIRDLEVDAQRIRAKAGRGPSRRPRGDGSGGPRGEGRGGFRGDRRDRPRDQTPRGPASNDASQQPRDTNSAAKDSGGDAS
ncbi:MAG: NOP5/NOP56 family protein [Thermoplasmatota archaeon]